MHNAAIDTLRNATRIRRPRKPQLQPHSHPLTWLQIDEWSANRRWSGRPV